MAKRTIKAGVFVEDGGDGSATAHLFKDRATAEKAADVAMERYGQRLCDDVDEIEIVFDDETGEVVNQTFDWEDLVK